MSKITPYHDDDDGFDGALTSGRLIKGTILRWNETNGWLDRDGLRPPEPLLVLACSEALQRWQNKRPIETITSKPLPDLQDLNAAVPQQEWEPGLDGRPKPPWVHQVLVYLIDPASAGFYTYLNSMVGARIAWDQLREKVITMRALRGVRVVPLVKLTHRPMKTAFGMKHRPEFEIVGWRNLGGEPPLGGQPPTPIAGPAAPKTPTAAETSDSAAPKVPTTAGEATIAVMEEVNMPTTAEEMDDCIPW